MARYKDMVQMFRQCRLDTDPFALALELAKFWEINIREPANKIANKIGAKKRALPAWSAADIYQHFWYHLEEGSNLAHQQHHELVQIARRMHDEELYDVRKNVFGKTYLSVNPERAKIYLAFVKERRAWTQLNVSHLMNYDQTYSLDADNMLSFVNTKRNWSVYDLPSQLAKKNKK